MNYKIPTGKEVISWINRRLTMASQQFSNQNSKMMSTKDIYLCFGKELEFPQIRAFPINHTKNTANCNKTLVRTVIT